MKKLRVLIISSVIMVAASLSLAPLQLAYAATPQEEVCKSIDDTGNCSKVTGVTLGKAVRAAVNILSIIVGVASVIMIIIAGLKYVTSSGDSSNIASAKSTLIYAIVGLVVAIAAQGIVRFVLKAVQ